MTSRFLSALMHPARTLERSAWKLRQLRKALREAWWNAGSWVRACNRRREVLDYGPINIFLEASSGCNLRCPMCPTGAGRVSRPKGMLDPALARKLASEIRHQPAQVGLWLAGEPLLNPRLEEIVAVLAERGLNVTLHSNATLLTEERARGLIEAGLGAVTFSFDATTPETYAAMRPGADLQEVVANIRRFLRLRSTLGRVRPHVTVQTIHPYAGPETHPYGTQPETPPEVRAWFEGLGVDAFVSIVAHSWSGQMEDAALAAPNQTAGGWRIACRIPYTDLTIAWNGDAVTCCGDLNGQVILGNLWRENLYDLWNNSRFQAFRRAIHGKAIERHPLCGACEMLWSVGSHRLDYTARLARLRYRLRI
jgi:MoaA/NifB/PqqE/SkfB family radical SAM enzyme